MSEASFGARMGALTALCAVSTCIGITMKISQVSGKYKYSPSSAVVMTEAFKLFISACFIVSLCFAKLRLQSSSTGAAAATTTTGDKHSSAENSTPGSRNVAEEEEMSLKTQLVSDTRTLSGEIKAFLAENVTQRLAMHAFGLAIAYAIVNNVTFAIFVRAPASTFFLLKAASPVVTAIMLWGMVGRKISPVQWLSIGMQCLGLIITQYNPCRRTAELTWAAYGLIFINVAVSCAAGVWNEHIIKTCGASVNAQNAVLYSFGIVINLVCFALIPPGWLGQADDLGFLAGYNWSVVGVVAANGTVGLVITVVYKYADVVVKTFGLAASTAIMYLMEVAGWLPGRGASVSAIFGAAVIFYASFLYIAPPLQPAASAASNGGGDGDDKAKASSMPPLLNHRVGVMMVLASMGIFSLYMGPQCSV